jgi:hypothetical protein
VERTIKITTEAKRIHKISAGFATTLPLGVVVVVVAGPPSDLIPSGGDPGDGDAVLRQVQ